MKEDNMGQAYSYQVCNNFGSLGYKPVLHLMSKSIQWQSRQVCGFGSWSTTFCCLYHGENNIEKKMVTKLVDPGVHHGLTWRGAPIWPKIFRYCVHHPCRMINKKLPEWSWPLLLHQIHACHMDHYFPMGFDESICRLTAHRLCCDWGFFLMKEWLNSTAKKSHITDAPELLCQGSRLITDLEQWPNLVVL